MRTHTCTRICTVHMCTCRHIVPASAIIVRRVLSHLSSIGIPGEFTGNQAGTNATRVLISPVCDVTMIIHSVLGSPVRLVRPQLVRVQVRYITTLLTRASDHVGLRLSTSVTLLDVKDLLSPIVKNTHQAPSGMRS